MVHDLDAIVYIVDDDVSIRDSLYLLLRSIGLQCRMFGSVEEFLLSVPRKAGQACLILDVCLPDLTGFDLLQRLAGEMLAAPVIFLTAYGDVPTTVRAMKAGAVEFLEKPIDDRRLLEAVQRALALSKIQADWIEKLRNLYERYDALTGRERQVMFLVTSGLLNKQVAGELGICEITVKVHRGNVMRKMQASTFVDLVLMAQTLRSQSGGPDTACPPGHLPSRRTLPAEPPLRSF